jgi:hypothetical protein
MKPIYRPKKKPPLEKVVEKYFKSEVGKLGGITFKFVSPMQNSVPDQILILNGRVIFCEIKRVKPIGRLSDKQAVVINTINTNYGEAVVIYGHIGVDSFVTEINKAQKWYVKLFIKMGFKLREEYE